MKRIIIFFFVFFFLVSVSYSQYNDRAILISNAQQLLTQRQFSQAEKLFLRILEKYPDDSYSVSQLFQIYLTTNQLEKAERLLVDYRSLINFDMYQDYQLQLKIYQGKIDEAWSLTSSIIELNSQNENKYRTIANYYIQKGFYEKAIDIYEIGRKALKRPDLFIMEIANAAFSFRQYNKALKNYIRLLEIQPDNFWFVSNQIKQMIFENPELIDDLRIASEVTTSNSVKELYAVSLIKIGNIIKALDIYKKLPADKLITFANEQFSAGNDSIAIAAYNILLDMLKDNKTENEEYTSEKINSLSQSVSINYNTIKLRLSELLIKQKRWVEAEKILLELINPENEERKKSPIPFVINAKANELLAEISLRLNKPIEIVINFYLKTLPNRFSNNGYDENYNIIRTYYVYNYIDKADSLLTLSNVKKPSPEFYYYKYLIASERMQFSLSDTLLNDLILKFPSSKYVNDILNINVILMNLSPNIVPEFLNAYRYKLRHQDSLAVNLLLSIAEKTKDEELRILASDWAIQEGLITTALSILNYHWEDSLISEYASLQKTRLINNPLEAENSAKEFLKSNPNSVFSPGFRQILQKVPTNRPTF